MFSPIIRLATTTTLNNPLTGSGMAVPLITPFVPFAKIFFALSGIGFVVAMVIAGVYWMTSRGNTQQIEKARQIYSWAIIGIITVFGAYIFLAFVFNLFAGATITGFTATVK